MDEFFKEIEPKDYNSFISYQLAKFRKGLTSYFLVMSAVIYFFGGMLYLPFASVYLALNSYNNYYNAIDFTVKTLISLWFMLIWLYFTYNYIKDKYSNFKKK
jgi:hypothetical protein